MKNIMKLVVAITFMAFSAGASAVSIGTVGSYDVLLGSSTLINSGEATEEVWIESVLGFDIDYTQLDDTSDATYWEAVDGVGSVAGDYAFDFTTATDPDYFLVKVGGGSGTGTDYSHYLFSNSDSMEWAFMNLSVFGEDVSLINIGIISHVGVTDGTTSVPEPGIVALLAIGLLGMVVARRKKTV